MTGRRRAGKGTPDEVDAEARMRRLFGDEDPDGPDELDASDAVDDPEPAAGDPSARAAAVGGSAVGAAIGGSGGGASGGAAEPWLDAGDARDYIPADPPGAAAATERVVLDTEPADDRRRLLWRDSATILIGVVAALLVVQVMSSPISGDPSASATDLPSGVVIETMGPQLSLPPIPTFGPIIDPSLGIDATPTPIPVITMGPTPTPGPSPTASPKPSGSPKASATPRPTRTPGTSGPPTSPPTVPPTAPPTQPPPTEPPPTAAPPVAQFTWNATVLAVDFTNTSTGDTSWEWDFGDGATSTAQNPTHLYTEANTYTVVLTVTGPGGSDTVSHSVTVPPP